MKKSKTDSHQPPVDIEGGLPMEQSSPVQERRCQAMKFEEAQGQCDRQLIPHVRRVMRHANIPVSRYYLSNRYSQDKFIELVATMMRVEQKK